ncbi:hypothetical protein V8Z80_18260 [Orrella sp. JC864]|uniref:hypothetical protein n=1 Tax=Orrella sp. JC864 TaxID=3120298 RepID=UPI003009E47B
MTSRRSVHIDRAVRLELLRARAAVEREALASAFSRVGRSLSPVAMLGGLRGVPASSLLAHGMALLRQYPFLLSSVSALFAAGRRTRLLRFGGMAMALWQGLGLLRRLRGRGAARRPRAPR